MSDETLAVKRAAAGDAAAFNQLVRHHQSHLRAFLLRLTGGRHALADDLAQETFLQAWRRIGDYRGDGAFAGWLLRIAWSRALMQARARKWQALDDSDLGAVDPWPDHAEHLDLERAMARLAPVERAALTLCFAMGYAHPEAAAILNLPLGTLKSHVTRGREKLRALLPGLENGHD